MAKGRSTRAVAAGVPAALVLALAQPHAAIAAPRPDYPSWDEVQAAKGDAARTEAEVDRIEGILIRLEQEAAALGQVALQAGEAYAQARDALTAATAKVQRIRAQAEAAESRAEASERRVALLVAQLARSGGGDVSIGLLLGSAADADAMLAQLGSASRLGDSSKAMLERAIYDKKTAEALAADARAAERERAKLADAAEEALESAEAAAGAAEAAVAAQRADVDRMYAQLAALKNTSVQIEREYYEGITSTPVNPPPSPSPSTPPGGTPNPTPSNPAPNNPAPTPSTPAPSNPAPSNPAPNNPPPNTSAVETAIAFATAQVGDRYQLAAMGPDAWDCSGLTKASYAAAGVYIGTHSATNQYNTMAAQGRLVPKAQMQRGDLLFYSSGSGIYHVTLYLGAGKMLEAPYAGVPVRIVNVRSGDLVGLVGRPTG